MDSMIHMSVNHYMFMKSTELGVDDVTESDLSDADKKFLKELLDSFKSSWQKIANK